MKKIIALFAVDTALNTTWSGKYRAIIVDASGPAPDHTGPRLTIERLGVDARGGDRWDVEDLPFNNVKIFASVIVRLALSTAPREIIEQGQACLEYDLGLLEYEYENLEPRD